MNKSNRYSKKKKKSIFIVNNIFPFPESIVSSKRAIKKCARNSITDKIPFPSTKAVRIVQERKSARRDTPTDQTLSPRQQFQQALVEPSSGNKIAITRGNIRSYCNAKNSREACHQPFSCS